MLRSDLVNTPGPHLFLFIYLLIEYHVLFNLVWSLSHNKLCTVYMTEFILSIIFRTH